MEGRVANDLGQGDRPQVGAADGSQSRDYSISSQAGQVNNGEVKVLVRAGQTMSDTFNVDAWKEKVTVDLLSPNNSNFEEGNETFKINIAGASHNNMDQFNTQGGMLNVNIQDKTEYKTVSPVAFDLNGDGAIGVTGESSAKVRQDGAELGRTVSFDMNSDGQSEQIEWVKGDGDGLLVDTSKIRDGQIDGSALFGDQNGRFDNGYQQMALRDTNGDGQLNTNELDGLAMWIDDGDAKLEAGELKSLSDLGIDQISTQKQDVQNDRGETLMRSEAQTNQGQRILTEDVWFGRAE